MAVRHGSACCTFLSASSSCSWPYGVPTKHLRGSVIPRLTLDGPNPPYRTRGFTAVWLDNLSLEHLTVERTNINDQTGYVRSPSRRSFSR